MYVQCIHMYCTYIRMYSIYCVQYYTYEKYIHAYSIYKYTYSMYISTVHHAIYMHSTYACCAKLQIARFGTQSDFQGSELTVRISMEEVETKFVTKETHPPGEGGVPWEINQVIVLVHPDVDSELDSSNKNSATRAE